VFILINLQLMILEYTLHHHVLGINAIALSHEGDRLLSGGKATLLTFRVTPNDDLTGDNANIVIWDILTGEKVQVISCAFHGPIGALAWIPELSSLVPSFAFSCADGGIHIYQCFESAVCKHHEFVNQSNIRYSVQLPVPYTRTCPRWSNFGSQVQCAIWQARQHR
jgi:WD40 repeat protein